MRRVGHAGTLDPAATGLLIVGVGAGTRLLTFLVGLDKRYEATIRLGISTTTDDAEGQVTSRVGCPGDFDVAGAIEAFRGPQLQRPSAVSAVKVAGVPAYRRARAGETYALPERPVVVHDLALREVRRARADGVAVLDLDVSLHVSSGTYVRAIARDLGQAHGGGHLTALRRTAVGPFHVSDAVPPPGVDPDSSVELQRRLLPLGRVAQAVLATVVVPEDDIAAVRHGARLPCSPPAAATSLRRLEPAEAGDRPVALLDGAGVLLAVATCSGGRWDYRFVVPA